MRTSLRVLGTLVTVGGLLIAGSSVPAAAGPGSEPIAAATATGFDLSTWSAADVVSGRSDNSILLRYTAGQAIDDATLQIDVPRADWPTRLRPVDEIRSDKTYRGAVLVRPAADQPLPDAGSGCTWPQTTAHIARSADSQTVVVPDLTCAVGQSLEIRLGNVRALGVGNHFLEMSIYGSTWAAAEMVPIQVVPTPRIRLEITAPPAIAFQTGFALRVTARRPDGSVATHYRGAVALVTEPDDCSAAPDSDVVAHEFTASDAGVADIPMWLGDDLTHVVEVHDTAHRAVSGVSKSLDYLPITVPYASVVCPVSYH